MYFEVGVCVCVWILGVFFGGKLKLNGNSQLQPFSSGGHALI